MPNSPLMNILNNNTHDSSPLAVNTLNALNASFSQEELRQDSLHQENKLSIEIRNKAQSGAGLFASQTKKPRYGENAVNQSLILKGSNDYDLKKHWPLQNKHSKTSRASTLTKS